MRSTKEIKILQMRQRLVDLLARLRRESPVVPLALYRRALVHLEICNDLLAECRQTQTLRLIQRN